MQFELHKKRQKGSKYVTAGCETYTVSKLFVRLTTPRSKGTLNPKIYAYISTLLIIQIFYHIKVILSTTKLYCRFSHKLYIYIDTVMLYDVCIDTRRKEFMKKISTRDIVLVGVFAAMIFVLTRFISIPIPTPTGQTMIKSANILCVLAGLLLGKTLGGLAAGFGSMIYDLTNPLYIASAPFTFAFFFLMAFIAGLVFEKTNKVAIASFLGTFSYLILYFTKSVITTVLQGSLFVPAVIANSSKLVSSGINVVIASIFATILYPHLKKAFNQFASNRN